MSNIKERVLDEIQMQEITPTSRFYFVTKNYFFALLFIFSVVVGAISFSAILENLILSSELAGTADSFMHPTLFFISLPLFWLFLLVCFTYSAWYNFKRTDGAHRKENAIIVLASILFSLLFGLLIFRIGLSGNLEKLMNSYVPTYRVTTEKRLERAAIFLQERDQDKQARDVLLKREQLRTICFNQGRNDCYARVDELTSVEVEQALEDIHLEVKENLE